MTLTKYMEQFENYHKYMEHSERTIHTYETWINLFFEYVSKEVEQVTYTDVRCYLMSNPNWTSATKHSILRSLNSFYTTLITKLKLINIDNPCDGIDLPKLVNKEKIPLTREEQNILIRNGKNARDKAILKVMFSTGVRVDELINITLDQYLKRDEYNGITLYVTKGNKPREIFLNKECVQAIEEYLKVRKETSHNNLFISNGGQPMDRTCMTRTIKTIARRSGEFEEDRISGICNHLTRTSFATTKAEEGTPVEILSRALGHSTTAVTSKVYVKVNREAIRMAMR